MDIEKIKVGDVIHDIRDAGALREIEGKGLSTNDYTNEDKSKLAGIEADAQKNKIESIKVNGSDVTPDPNKAVNVSVPTKMSDLNLDGGNMASGASLRFKNASSSMVIQPFGIVKESNNQSHVISFPDKQGTVALTSDIPDVSGKQDTIQDLETIRSGAAKGETSVQPLDIEGMVKAEPIGSIIPPVNPSEFATKEEVSQLDQEVTGLETDLKGGEVSIPIDIGTNTNNIGYYGKTNGALSANPSYRYYPPVNLSEYVGKTLKMEVEWTVAPSSGYDNAICIFTLADVLNWGDSTAKGYVGEYQLYSMREGTKATLITTIEKPYLRISTHKNSGCTISVEVISTSAGRVPTLESKVQALETDIVGKMEKGSVTPKDIKQNPFLEDFRFCTILPNKAVSSVTTIDGKTYIYWDNSTTDWYTIAINIQSYKDLLLVSDILPQSTISRFLTVGIDTGETNIEFVAWADSNEGFSLSPNAYVFDNEKMTITLSTLFLTYEYRGNIVLYIKMPTAYKINWLASGMQLEGYDWMKIGSYAKAELKEELRSDNVKIVMPSTIYTVVGHEMNIYFDGVVQCDDINRYDVDFSMGSMTTVCKLQNERLRIFPESIASGIAFTMYVYDKMNHDVIASKSFTVKANADTKFEKKGIFIGDSLTDRCIYPVEICQELGDNKLVSLGTRFDSLSYDGSDGVVTATNFANEGRGGWSALTYTRSASWDGVVNAFWNPSAKDGNGGFDFAYYMSQNNFNSADFVAIVLGPNDISGIITGGSTMDGVISRFREMVDSIHSYNSGIKVIVSLPPHSAEPNGVGTNGPAYNMCQKELVERLIAEFDGETNVYLAPVFANIDYHNDYPYDDVPISARNPKIVSRQNNNVHFSKDSTNPVSQCWGYLKMADAIWYTMVAAFGEN